MPPINHVLLTRFNLPPHGVESVFRARDGWLEERVALFERYCAPSVMRQTNADLTWLVYFDPQSPSWLWERLGPLIGRGLFTPLLRASVSRDELLDDIRNNVRERRDVLLTTNLDNDDGLANDFSERLSSVATGHDRAAVYLTHGLVKSSGALFLRKDRRNAFCSVRETWDAPVTAWGEYHNQFGRVMPTIDVSGAPAWLQVVHGANVSNRVRGRRVGRQRFVSRFGDMLEDVVDPRPTELLLDRVAGHPARVLRDSGRAVARRAGLRLLGKDGYGRAKLLISSAARGR